MKISVGNMAMVPEQHGRRTPDLPEDFPQAPNSCQHMISARRKGFFIQMPFVLGWSLGSGTCLAKLPKLTRRSVKHM